MRVYDLPQTSGIYGIANTMSGRIYVGQTCRFRDRWGWHKVKLRRGTHDNAALQSDWYHYGHEKFEFRILQEMSGDEFYHAAKEREYFHMALHFDNLYNVRYPLYVPQLAVELKMRPQD